LSPRDAQAQAGDWSRARSDAARAISPPLAAGLDLIHRVIEEDGALPAAMKALFAAAAAANKGREQLTAAKLERARVLGVTSSEVGGAAIALLLARGEGAFEALTRAAALLFAAEPPDASPPTDAAAAPDSGELTTTTTELALEYFREHFGGEVPLRQRVLAEIAPLAFEGYQLMHRAALKQNVLSPRDVELAMCAINASDYAGAFLEIHIAGARAVGANEAQIAEAVLCAIPAAGIAVWPAAAEAIIRTRD
jgi:alkylhydroperoxidase/carboxymuconolactone decarboxylase family protein YurZ